MQHNIYFVYSMPVKHTELGEEERDRQINLSPCAVNAVRNVHVRLNTPVMQA